VYFVVAFIPKFWLHSIGQGKMVCIGSSSSAIMSFSWVSVFIFEAVTFSLVAFKGFIHWRADRELGPGIKGSTLMQILVRDSVVYFFVVLMMGLQDYTLSISSILASRMLFNIRLEGSRRVVGDIPSWVPELSQFDAAPRTNTGTFAWSYKRGA